MNPTQLTPRRSVAVALGPGDLRESLAALREVCPGDRELIIALLPPVTQLRRVELPRLRDDELQNVLARDAGRYIVPARSTQIVAASPHPRGRGSPVSYSVSFASADFVQALYTAATEMGWRISRVVSAYDAWAAWLLATDRVASGGVGYLLVTVGGRREALRFERGRLAIGRRFVASMPMRNIVERLSQAESEIPWFASANSGDTELRDAASACGAVVLDGNERGPSPEELASRWAIRAAGGEFVPGPVRAVRQQRVRVISRRFLTAAALLLLLTAGLHLWGTQRELAVIRERRASMAKAVAQAVDLRAAMEGLDARLETLAMAEAQAPRWSGVIADLAERLPHDAHLLSLRASGDSLLLQGVAGRAAGVFESMQSAERIAGVRAEAPIRQETPDSGPPVESFVLGARLSGTW